MVEVRLHISIEAVRCHARTSKRMDNFVELMNSMPVIRSYD